jgi:hypothetical protein
MRASRSVEAQFVEYVCDSCMQGVYRVDEEPTEETLSTFLKSSTKLWRHVCSNCDSSVYLAAPYPLIEYRDKPFVLASRAGVKGNPVLKLGREK